MKQQDVDDILYHQLVVARLGEKELMNWWNTDIAYELGGSAFLKDLLGETMAPISAAEGILEAARLKELSLFREFPNSESPVSLFIPEPQLQTLLKERMRHFKRYPEDLPEKISNILNPKTDFSSHELKALVSNSGIPEFSNTSFGKELLKPDNLSSKECLLLLSAGIAEIDKNQYTLHYYTGSHNVAS